jgi:L-rhamnose mutarotase
MFAHQKTLEWRAMMKTMLEPLPTRTQDEWWAEMEEVFHAE